MFHELAQDCLPQQPRLSLAQPLLNLGQGCHTRVIPCAEQAHDCTGEAQMLFHPAVLERRDLYAQPSGAPETPLYPDDLLPALQSTLAALADVETRYEIARDGLEDWSGPDEVKQRLIAELEAGWQRERDPVVLRLAELQSHLGTAGGHR
jgi:hypothetical protein